MYYSRPGYKYSVIRFLRLRHSKIKVLIADIPTGEAQIYTHIQQLLLYKYKNRLLITNMSQYGLYKLQKSAESYRKKKKYKTAIGLTKNKRISIPIITFLNGIVIIKRIALHNYLYLPNTYPNRLLLLPKILTNNSNERNKIQSR